MCVNLQNMKETVLFSGKIYTLTKILHDRRSRQIPSLLSPPERERVPPPPSSKLPFQPFSLERVHIQGSLYAPSMSGHLSEANG